MQELSSGEKLRTLRKDFIISFIILLMLLTINFFSWQLSKISYQRNTKAQFVNEASYIKKMMINRVVGYTEALEFGEKFIQSSTFVERDEFTNYFSEYSGEHYTAIDGIFYVQRIKGKDRDAFVEEVRKDKSLSTYGYPFFNLPVAQLQQEYQIINYIVPFERNKTLFGLDINGEEKLYETAYKAMISEHIAVSPEVQIANINRIFIFKAIYDNQKPHSTEEQRREALKGYIMVMIRPDKLFDGILDNTELYNKGGMSYAVYGDDIKEEDLSTHIALYEDSNETASLNKKEDLFTETTTLDFIDKKYTVFFTSNPNMTEESLESRMPDLFFYGTSFLSFVMFIVLSSVVQNYVRADPDKKE